MEPDKHTKAITLSMTIKGGFMIEEFNDRHHDEPNLISEWSPPTWQRVTPDKLTKDIWCPGCAVYVTAGLPKTVLHICDKNGGR